MNETALKDRLKIIAKEKGLLENGKLLAAIHTTFQHRGTNLKLPIEFNTLGMKNLQILWADHLLTLGVFKEQLDLPNKIIEVIQEINGYLESTLYPINLLYAADSSANTR